MNFARIAEDMGALGIRVEQPAAFPAALAQALAADRPAVIDVVTGHRRAGARRGELEPVIPGRAASRELGIQLAERMSRPAWIPGFAQERAPE